MSEEAPRRTWAGILNRAANTDPEDKVVRLRRQPFEQLEGNYRRALDARHELTAERKRLENAYANEMARIDGEIREADKHLAEIQDQIRLRLSEIGVSARFVGIDDGGTNETPV